MDELARVRNDYLSLMINCLSGSIYNDPAIPIINIQGYNDELREYGWDWPSVAHTMIGRKRLENIRTLIESVLGNGIPGDFIETGVWRGGACIMMRACLNAYNIDDRRVWVADSFMGVPEPNEQAYIKDQGQKFHTYDALSVPVDEVKDNFAKYGLLDEKVCFLEGWFKDTLPNAPIDQLAIFRLDGDLYESTIQALEALYDKVTPNGYIIVDDYNVVAPCQSAVTDFLRNKGISPQLKDIDGVGVYWKKEETVEYGNK